MTTKNVTFNGTNYLLSDDPHMAPPPGRVHLTGQAVWSVADGIAREAVGDPHFFGIVVGNPAGVEREIASKLKAGTILVFQ